MVYLKSTRMLYVCMYTCVFVHSYVTEVKLVQKTLPICIKKKRMYVSQNHLKIVAVFLNALFYGLLWFATFICT